eukprot:CAMPEP_0174253408 /NCGR_PEP_ID=MMETSP0439-20130205/2784_1 /TAXON_ID=0 /ORGANISM="Stereomyxa ramosa, Strain Chinc5" /LENGTH=195 /DNA_ID=CAMNT_0015334421 /DNA_START=99 /DNA_END=686 /DNA_ORIENTATION=-
MEEVEPFIVVAIQDHSSTSHHSLFFRRGQSIAVLAEDKENAYYKGQLQQNVGCFPSYFVQPAEGIVKCGYLTKRGAWVKSWKRRWFELNVDTQTLSYRANPGDTSLLGIIPVKDIKNVDLIRAEKIPDETRLAGSTSKFLAVELPQRTYYFQGDEEEETVKWMDILLKTLEGELSSSSSSRKNSSKRERRPTVPT